MNEYDFTESRWSVVPAAGRRPRARYRATCVVFRNSMISYGGHDGTRHLSDAHIFDFDTRTWSTLVTEGTPPIPRDSHVSVVHGNSMYCFGGSSGSAMNDLHELQLPSSPSAPAKWYVLVSFLWKKELYIILFSLSRCCCYGSHNALKPLLAGIPSKYPISQATNIPACARELSLNS